MIKSIQNVGESEGGRGVITHSRAYPFVPVLKWSACTPLKKVAKRQIAASKQGKVVIKVVRDFIFVWKPNYTALSLAFCIGEQNRCSNKTKIFKCEVILIEVNRQLLKGALLPPIAYDFLEGDGSEIFSRYLPI